MNVPLHHLVTFLLLLTLVVFHTGCKKNEPTSPAPTPPPVDTNWVTHPQVDVPWPSLAQSSWPMFCHDPQHTGRCRYSGPQEGRVEWLFDAGFTVYSSPAIGLDGTVYFACLNRYFYAVGPLGSQKWVAPAGGGDSSPLIASDGTIYIYGGDVAQQNVCLYSYDQSGNLNWQYSIGEFRAFSSPSIAKG